MMIEASTYVLATLCTVAFVCTLLNGYILTLWRIGTEFDS
jgi:hypothetical protein